ncbi:MAG: AMP-binding protein [Alphaproteobacteria bacterium]|nr:AMP-binding protein [Alphaproteobacteria bacterium]
MSALYNLGDLVNRSKDPSAIALIDLNDANGVREYTHGDLDKAACAVARGLRARDLKPGERIAILSSNRVEFLTAYLGTMRAGMVSVPINYKFPNETVSYILQDADIKMIFADAERASRAPSAIPVVTFGDEGPNGFDAFCDPGAFETIRPAPGEVAMFLYTSGSTGRPKGVPLTHEGHLWVVNVRIDPPPDADHRVLVAAPLYHMNGLAMCKLAIGAHLTIILLPQFTAKGYIEAIGKYGVTWLTSVPTMLAMVARERELLEKTDLSSVRIARMGSAPVSQKLYDDLRDIFPNALITNGYGTTEGGPSVYGVHPDGLPQPGMSIGYPRPDCDARLVDSDDLDADQGVLQCRNPSVMPGYHNLPEKTAEVLSEDGWYDTGDIMRRDEDGFHYFVGRADDMFNCGGENVYPAEVEKMLERHPDIEQACVVPVPDEIKGYKPSAFVVPMDGKQLDEQSVKAFALANGPAYQHPRQVVFMESLPLTGTNKIDRKQLTERATATAAEMQRETA